MKFRKSNDYKLIANLNKPVHELHTKLYPTYFKPYNANSIEIAFQSIMNNDGHIFLVLDDNKTDIGYAWIEIKDYSENPFRYGYTSVFVHQLCINKNNRNKGYGSALIEEIYSFAIENNISIVELDYWADNEIMKKFCLKHGFNSKRNYVFKNINITN